MSDASRDITRILTRELEGFQRELALFPDDDTLWQTVPGVTNSAGNLALHVAGGLQHFIGAVLGGSGYKRNREAEFSRRSGTRAEVIAETKAALTIVRDVLSRLSEERLTGEFPELVMGKTLRTNLFLLHLCVHAGFHLGQAGYLRRAVTGDSRTSGPVPLEALTAT